MNQRKLMLAGSWVATISVVAFGLWLRQRFGASAMWIALALIVATLVLAQIWISSKAARARLELQELIHQLAGKTSIQDIQRQYPEFLPTMRKLPAGSMEDILEALDEDQARDLRQALRSDRK